MIGQAQGGRDFQALSDYIFSFVITCFYIENKFQKCTSGESDDEGVFVVLELFFRKQVQFEMFI
jgi:hypothetical protein